MFDPPRLFEAMLCLMGCVAAAKTASWAAYQATWHNENGRIDDVLHHAPEIPKVASSLPFWNLISRWRWLPFHIVALVGTAMAPWQELPTVRWTLLALLWLLAAGSLLRNGPANRGNWLWKERLLALILTAAASIRPELSYPALVAILGIQYSTASWPLGPGYSNLIGFELARGLIVTLLAMATISGFAETRSSELQTKWETDLHGFANWDAMAFTIATVMLASWYWMHGVAKLALPPSPDRPWYPGAWAIRNRTECLIVNAYLRGWRPSRSVADVCDAAKRFAKFRIPLNLAVLIWELGFPFTLADSRFFVAWLVITPVFHLGVFFATGLLVHESVLVAVVWIAAIIHGNPSLVIAFRIDLLVVILPTLFLLTLWIGWNRIRLLRKLQSGHDSRCLRFGDPFDHLMAWWDTPRMQIYSHLVQSADGVWHGYPVTQFSPYDTAMTDLPTHLNLLGRHPDFDPAMAKMPDWMRVGVWGITIDESHRDRLMDFAKQKAVATSPPIPNGEMVSPQNGEYSGFDVTASFRKEAHDAKKAEAANAFPNRIAFALRAFLREINCAMKHPVKRRLLRYPHFPGEDLVPDICPLLRNEHPLFDFRSSIESYRVERIETLYTGDSIRVTNRITIGCLRLHDSPHHETLPNTRLQEETHDHGS